MLYDDTTKIWHPNMTDNHVHIGAFDYDGNQWLDGTPFNYSNWVNNTAIYSSGVDELNAAIMPDFVFMPGAWDNIGDRTEARAGVCVYDPCSRLAQNRSGSANRSHTDI